MATSGSASAGGLRAAALLFSGRPDPEWPVDGERAEALRGLIDAAPPAGAPPPPAPPLGYRGVRLVAEGAGRSWLAYAGVVVEERAGRVVARRADPGRRLERAALASAPAGTLPAIGLEDLLGPARE